MSSLSIVVSGILTVAGASLFAMFREEKADENAGASVKMSRAPAALERLWRGL